jgi:hypothetical protein
MATPLQQLGASFVGRTPMNVQRVPATTQPVPMQTQAAPQQTQQFGLSGAEQALQAGLGAGVSSIEPGS